MELLLRLHGKSQEHRFSGLQWSCNNEILLHEQRPAGEVSRKPVACNHPNNERVQSLEYDEYDMVVKENLGPRRVYLQLRREPSADNGRGSKCNNDSLDVWRICGCDGEASFQQGYSAKRAAGGWESTKWVVDPNTGMVVTESHDASGGTYAGGRTEFTYDSSLNLTQVRRKQTDTPNNTSTDLVTTYQYVPQLFNQLTSITDPMGNVTAMAIDPQGNTTSITRPTVTQPTSQSATETATYDVKGRITSSTDAEGRLTTFSY